MSGDIPDFAVLRPAAGVSSGWLGDFHGRWYDLRDVPFRHFDATPTPGQAVATPTDRLEVREDGAVAQVWEVRPA